MGRVRIFIACSLDGFIAGPDDDLSWLPDPTENESDEYGFDSFLSQIGALLMGRNTYEVATGFEGPWAYGDLPLFVATNRPLKKRTESVHAVSGRIFDLIEKAKAQAGEKDVYLDGGNLIRQALDAELVDEITLTMVPVVLGHGSPLFAGVAQRQRLVFRHSKTLADGLVQLTYRVGE